MNNFSSDIHSGIYYKQNNKSTHILSKIFPSISYNISYRSMLKNTDIITNIKSKTIYYLIVLHLAYNQQRGLNCYNSHLYYHF